MLKINNQALMRYQKQDVELENYLTQKYLKSDAGGLVGKVFRKDDDGGSKSGRFKCENCGV